MFTRSTQPALLGGLWNEVDRWFGDLFGELPAERWTWEDRSRLPVNVWEDEEGYHLEAEVPALAAESLELDVVGNRLVLAGNFPETPAEGVKFYREERPRGAFRRELTLPADIDTSRVDARVADGVLTVTLPKAEAAKPRRLKIKKAD